MYTYTWLEQQARYACVLLNMSQGGNLNCMHFSCTHNLLYQLDAINVDYLSFGTLIAADHMYYTPTCIHDCLFSVYKRNQNDNQNDSMTALPFHQLITRTANYLSQARYDGTLIMRKYRFSAGEESAWYWDRKEGAAADVWRPTSRRLDHKSREPSWRLAMHCLQQWHVTRRPTFALEFLSGWQRCLHAWSGKLTSFSLYMLEGLLTSHVLTSVLTLSL